MVIRIAILALLAFLLQLLVSLYRYDTRLASYYDARADALILAPSDEALVQLIPMFSPDTLTFGPQPKFAFEHVLDLARTLSRQPGPRGEGPDKKTR